MKTKKSGSFIVDLLKAIGCFYLTAIVYGVIGSIIYSIFFPDTEVIPGNWSAVILLIAFGAGIFSGISCWKKRRSKSGTDSIADSESRAFGNQAGNDLSTKIPSSKKKQAEMAEDILSNIGTCISLANKTNNISLFVDWYEEALDGFSTLMKFDKVNFKSPPSVDYYELKDEFQWHLCDAIVRSKEATISEIKNKYKNSKEFQRRAAILFESLIDEVKDRFSQDTAELAASAIADVKRAAGMEASTSPLSQGRSPDLFAQYGGPDAELLSVDLMDGSQFEEWCADLLKDLGYSDVSRTGKAGDQGVDLLATKDGVRYAIQCKCYSSDLGNTPVQEINTGKVIYRCQIGVVMTNRHFTPGGKAAAEATGVLLWDRDWLYNAISTCTPAPKTLDASAGSNTAR